MAIEVLERWLRIWGSNRQCAAVAITLSATQKAVHRATFGPTRVSSCPTDFLSSLYFAGGSRRVSLPKICISEPEDLILCGGGARSCADAGTASASGSPAIRPTVMALMRPKVRGAVHTGRFM